MSTRKCAPSGRNGQWLVPATSVMLGIAYLVIGLAHDRVRFGVSGLIVMLLFAAGIVLFRQRTEVAALFGGDESDERRAQLQLRAGAFTGRVLLVVIVAGLFWSLITQNRYEGVFSALAVIGGGSLLISTVLLSRRG